MATKPRRIWLAALLGLIAGPLAQVYVGHFRRAVVLWIGWILLDIFIFFALVTFRFPYLLTTLFTIEAIYRLFIIIDACRIARRDRNSPLKRYQRWWIYLILCVLLYAANYLFAYTARAFIGEAFALSSRSMAPTLQPGDRFLVDTFWTDPKKVKRNDLIVFRTKLLDYDETAEPTAYVMRVIGLPGETVEVKDERLFINGEPIDDRHAIFDGPKPVTWWPEGAKLVNYGPEKIPEDNFFALGDNRRLSRDSRLVGPIPFSDYYGNARFIYWSRKYSFPKSNYAPQKPVPGPIQWDRFGMRLDHEEKQNP